MKAYAVFSVSKKMLGPRCCLFPLFAFFFLTVEIDIFSLGLL